MSRDIRLAPRLRQGAVVIILACLVLVVSSCGENSNHGGDGVVRNPGTQPTITQHEAAQRAEEYVQRSLSALPAQARLEKQSSDITSCDDPTDNGPKGRIIASNSYWLRELPEKTNQEYFDNMLHYWTTNGFIVLDDARPTDYFISVEHRSDGFQMSLEAGKTGALNIGASSPCVWPNGTPPPSVISGG